MRGGLGPCDSSVRLPPTRPAACPRYDPRLPLPPTSLTRYRQQTRSCPPTQTSCSSRSVADLICSKYLNAISHYLTLARVGTVPYQGKGITPLACYYLGPDKRTSSLSGGISMRRFILRSSAIASVFVTLILSGVGVATAQPDTGGAAPLPAGPGTTALSPCQSPDLNSPGLASQTPAVLDCVPAAVASH